MPHSTGRAFNHPLPSTSLPLSLSLLLPLTTLPVLSPHSPSSHHTHPPLRLISYSSSRDEDAINRRSQSFGDSLPSWLRWKSWTTHIKGGKRSRSWLNSSMSVKWVICDLRAKSWGGEGGREGCLTSMADYNNKPENLSQMDNTGNSTLYPSTSGPLEHALTLSHPLTFALKPPSPLTLAFTPPHPPHPYSHNPPSPHPSSPG